MSTPNTHLIEDFNNPLLATHYAEMMELFRQDLREEHDIAKQSALYDPMITFDVTKSDDEIGKDITGYIQEGVGVFHVLDGALVGMGFAYKLFGVKCMIGPLVVKAEYRRRGICTEMITVLEDAMRERGMSASVMIVLKDNPALSLYRGVGYGEESHVLGRAL